MRALSPALARALAPSRARALAPALVLVLVLVLVAQSATAQTLGYAYAGGEPGVIVTVGGRDIEGAATAGGAIVVTLDAPLDINFTVSPPAGETWHVGAIRVSVLLAGPTRGASVSQSSEWNAEIPPGFTVLLNRTVDLTPMKPVGAGLFLMRVQIVGADGADLYARDFYAKVSGVSLLSASGAAVAVASVASGYGLWNILRDLREAYQAKRRHAKQEKHRSKLSKAVDATVGLASLEVDDAVEVAGGRSKTAERIERRRPIAWTVTGLSLGAVVLSWAQFLGYVPVNFASTLIWALTTAALFLMLALLTTALVRRAQKKRLEATMRRVPVEDGQAAAAAVEAPPEPRADKKP